jgi:hypothetical protein
MTAVVAAVAVVAGTGGTAVTGAGITVHPLAADARVARHRAGGGRAVGERDRQHAVLEGLDRTRHARRLRAEVLQPVAALTIAVAVAIARPVPLAAAIEGAMVATGIVAG